MSGPSPRRGEVIEVTANAVVVRDDTGEIHNFVTGSLNGVSPTYRCVGVVGALKYIRTSTMSLWYFQPD